MQQQDLSGEVRHYVDEAVAAAARQSQFILSALSNHAIATNGGSIGGANPAVAWISSTFTPRVSGKVLVMATISGTNATVSEAMTFGLIRGATASVAANLAGLGGTQVGPGPGTMGMDGGLHGDFAFSLQWIDSTAVGVGVTYAIAAVATHNLTVAIGQAAITLIELPA